MAAAERMLGKRLLAARYQCCTLRIERGVSAQHKNRIEQSTFARSLTKCLSQKRTTGLTLRPGNVAWLVDDQARTTTMSRLDMAYCLRHRVGSQ